MTDSDRNAAQVVPGGRWPAAGISGLNIQIYLRISGVIFRRLASRGLTAFDCVSGPEVTVPARGVAAEIGPGTARLRPVLQRRALNELKPPFTPLITAFFPAPSLSLPVDTHRIPIPIVSVT